MTAVLDKETLKQKLLLAQIRRNNAEAEQYEAEAAGARAAADLAAAQSAHLIRDFKYEEAADQHHRVFKFDGAVNAGSVTNCIGVLSRWSRLNPGCDIEIVFNSPGGAVIDGMALFDFIRHLDTKGHRVTTVARGYAASMGGILLQAGTHRVIGAESYLMIHEISAGAGGKIGEIQDAVKFYETICKQVVDIFVRRSGGKITKAAFERNWKRQDWWLTAKEAAGFGFVDEIR